MSFVITRPPFLKESSKIPIEDKKNMVSSLSTNERVEEEIEMKPQALVIERPKFEYMEPVAESVAESTAEPEEAVEINPAGDVTDSVKLMPTFSEKEAKDIERALTNYMSFTDEAFVSESKVSIKFGILGLGQAGGKIADVFAACKLPGKETATYPALAINTCVADIRALKNIPAAHRIELPNYDLGAMRQPDVGYEAITQDGVLEDIIDRVSRVFETAHHIIVTAGIGGGTGTGTLQVLCEQLAEKGYPITAMITLPRNLDSVEEKKNAVDFLTAFQELLYSGVLSSAIVVDNNLLYERYSIMSKKEGTDIDWKNASNEEIVRIINELNATTGLASDDTFDGAELKKILSSGGCVTFGKALIDSSTDRDGLNESAALRIQDILHHGYLADYSNLIEARYAGVQVIHPPQQEFGPILEKTLVDVLKKEMPALTGTYIGHAEIETEKNIIIYTIASGMGLPGRAQELAQLLAAEVERINEADAKRSTFVATEVVIRNPFQKNGTKAKSTSNPFSR